MITGFFLGLIFSFISFLLALLPTGGTFPTEWITAIQTFWYAVNQFSYFLPVATIVTCIGLMVSFQLFEFAWRFIHWVLGIIRGHKV